MQHAKTWKWGGGGMTASWQTQFSNGTESKTNHRTVWCCLSLSASQIRFFVQKSLYVKTRWGRFLLHQLWCAWLPSPKSPMKIRFLCSSNYLVYANYVHLCKCELIPLKLLCSKKKSINTRYTPWCFWDWEFSMENKFCLGRHWIT